jgi:hypothetical protein
MTDEEKKKIDKRRRRIALLVGVVLALICHALPPDYRGPCETIAHICRGGL